MENAQNSDTDVIQKIENDDFYRFFLTPNNNAAKTTITETLTISEQIKKLTDGIELISRELQKQVLEKHDDLLRQGNHATKLEEILNVMNGHVQNLFANAERLKNQISIPYNALENYTKVLERLHLASHILRQVNRIQQLNKRLKNTNDPVQKASILYELEQLIVDPDLKDIDIVTTELRNIREQQQKVVKLATSSLNQSLINENPTQITTALQIFINLGTVNEMLQNSIELRLSECRESLKIAFNINNITQNVNKNNRGPGRVNLTSSQGFRNRIWVELERSFNEEIYQQSKQIKFLQNIVNNLNSHFINVDIASKFWSELGAVISDEIKNTSPAIRQMLDEDYPKLLKCYYEMYGRLKYDKFQFDRQILEDCENSYLSTSLSRLLEPIQVMFGGENELPTHDQIDSLVRIITNELSVALIETILIEKICKNVAKTIKMFVVKTEQQLETGPESVQVIGGSINSSQQKNQQYANCLNYLQIQIQRILTNMNNTLPSTSLEIINESLGVLENLIGAIIQPLIVSINSTIETIIVTIHLESDWNKLSIPINKTNLPCSPYMRELTQFINRVYHTYLINFDHKQILLSKCSEIVVRCIELLIRHSALLRPISASGRSRLHSDYQHLETVLKVICPHLTNLGRPYRQLKSMASLLILQPDEIVANYVVESSIPSSIILLLLFSFATSNELASPHQNTGWSLAKLSNWFDQHQSELERLDLIAGALQRYETIIRQKNSTNYDPIYPIMSQFLENAVKNLK